MKEWLKRHPHSIVTTIIVSIILIILYLIFLQPSDPSNYLPFIALNLVSPWIIFLLTQILSIDKKAKNYLSPDFDIIPIFNPLYSFMLQEKRYAIKINIFDDYIKELKKYSVLWLYKDLGSDKITAAYSIFKRSKNNFCIWINLNNRNIKFPFLCNNIYNHIKHHIKTDLTEEVINTYPHKVFDVLNESKYKFLIIFDNFREIEFDDSENDLIYLFDGWLKKIIESKNSVLFLTQSKQNMILSSSILIKANHPLNRLKTKILLKKYLKTFKVTVSDENLERLISISNYDASTVKIFIDIYLDLKKRFGVKYFNVVEILSMLNNYNLFHKYFEEKIVNQLTVSEIESLEFLSVFERHEDLLFIKNILEKNNLINYDFVDSVSRLEAKRLIYSANMVDLSKIFGLKFPIKIKNRLYRKYFSNKIKHQKNKVFLHLNDIISQTYLNYLITNKYNIEIYKGIFLYSLISRNYQRCIEMLNLYDRTKIHSIINTADKLPKQDIYEFIKERVDLIPSDEIINNDKVLLKLIKIHIAYEYFLWGINEKDNIEYCYQTIDKLYKDNSQNPIVLIKYPVVIMAYYRFMKIAFENLDEIEFSLNNLFKRYIKILNQDDIAFYQLLLAKVYYLKNNSYQYNILISSAEKAASSSGVKGQILFEKARVALEFNDILEALKLFDDSLKYLSLARYYHIVMEGSKVAMEVANLHNLFNYLEIFNKYLMDAMLNKFYEQNEREILFTRIFQNYNFSHYTICISLCSEYLKRFENEKSDGYFNETLNVYIILFDCLINGKKYNEMKLLYNDIYSKIIHTYFIHLINYKYLHLIDDNIGDKSWREEGIRICKQFNDQPYYILKLANYFKVSNSLNDAIEILDTLIRNREILDEYRVKAIQLSEEIKEIIGGS